MRSERKRDDVRRGRLGRDVDRAGNELRARVLADQLGRHPLRPHRQLGMKLLLEARRGL